VLCGMLIHSSDFGASTKEFEVCREWSRLVNEEFMNQSKKEAELGIPQSPFMLNLDNELVMAKNELGFLKFMVQPLYKSLSESFAGESISGMMLENVSKNIER
jgi:cAMP-specific phosphodiesterase 4